MFSGELLGFPPELLPMAELIETHG